MTNMNRSKDLLTLRTILVGSLTPVEFSLDGMELSSGKSSQMHVCSAVACKHPESITLVTRRQLLQHPDAGKHSRSLFEELGIYHIPPIIFLTDA